LPDFVVADVSNLAVGETIQISDLPEVDGVEYLGESSLVIVSVQQPTVFVETTEAVDEIAADEVPATEVSDDSGEESEEGSKEDSNSD
jgi:large subunit ribosomal protein L25